MFSLNVISILGICYFPQFFVELKKKVEFISSTVFSHCLYIFITIKYDFKSRTVCLKFIIFMENIVSILNMKIILYIRYVLKNIFSL